MTQGTRTRLQGSPKMTKAHHRLRLEIGTCLSPLKTRKSKKKPKKIENPKKPKKNRKSKKTKKLENPKKNSTQ